jgi:hypothetical protein
MVNINEINTLIKSFRHRWKIMLLNMYKPIL